MNNSNHTARFWIPINGSMAKLSIQVGEYLTHTAGGAHEEGYSYTTRHFTYANGVITVRVDTEASDCDGRIDFHKVLHAAEGDVTKYAHHDHPILNWKKVSERQRDYRAEAAGY